METWTDKTKVCEEENTRKRSSYKVQLTDRSHKEAGETRKHGGGVLHIILFKESLGSHTLVHTHHTHCMPGLETD